jgi:hypothetical protein
MCAPGEEPAVAPPDDEKEPLPAGARIESYEVVMHQGNDRLVLRGNVDPDERRVVLAHPGNQRAMQDIDSAVATFTTTAGVATVKVAGVVQTSGVTPNDFRRDLAYTLHGAAGDSVTCTVTTFAAPQTTGLPVIRVDTQGEAIRDKENYVPCTFSFADPDDPDNDRVITLAADGIRLRGNTTAGYDKKPYRLKFDKKEGFFGLGKAKSWVLLANYLDPTLLANTVAFEVGRRFAERHQGSRPFVNSAHHVELFVNDDYVGSYLFTEQVQVNEHRVNIDEEEDYFLELDTYYDEANKFKIDLYPGSTETKKLPVNIKSPEEAAGAAALPAIRAEVQLLVDRLGNNRAFDGPAAGYRDLVDAASAVDFIMMNEVVGNPELQHPKSTYMYKTQGGKWEFGPLWDFDWGFGYAGGGFTYFKNPTKFFYSAKTDFASDPRAGNVFFTQFFLDPAFRAEYKARWNEMKPHLATLAAFVGEMGGRLARSAAQNKIRWSKHYIAIDYAAEIAHMQQYVTTRLNYLDGVINASSW